MAHDDAIVRPDEHGAERMMAMRRRLARDVIGGEDAGGGGVTTQARSVEGGAI